MLEKVITGGQLGADLGGWRAARRFSIPSGGWIPRGYKTEAGPRPDFALLYGAEEYHSDAYAARTRHNLAYVGDKGGTAVVFDANERMSPGTRCLVQAHADLVNRLQPYPGLVVIRLRTIDGKIAVANPAYGPEWLVRAIRNDAGTHLLVAGNRESSAPGIGAFVEEYLCDAFRQLGFRESDR